MSKYFTRTARAARRAQKLEKFAGVGNAITNREAKMRLTSQNIGQHAIGMVREILDSYSLPSRPNLGYSGVRSAKLASNKVEQGVITVHAEFRTKTGVNVGIDIPVEVRDGMMIEPSVVLVNGSPRIIAQSTFDDIVAHNTFTQMATIRPLYSAPLSKDQNSFENKNRIERVRVNKGLFSASVNRDALKQAMSGRAITAQYKEFDYDDVDPSRNVDPDDFSNPAEREPGLCAGDTTTLSEEVEIKNRGGGVESYSSGTSVMIVRDHAGDGTAYVVEFDDGLQAIVESSMLKGAQVMPNMTPEEQVRWDEREQNWGTPTPSVVEDVSDDANKIDRSQVQPTDNEDLGWSDIEMYLADDIGVEFNDLYETISECVDAVVDSIVRQGNNTVSITENVAVVEFAWRKFVYAVTLDGTLHPDRIGINVTAALDGVSRYSSTLDVDLEHAKNYSSAPDTVDDIWQVAEEIWQIADDIWKDLIKAVDANLYWLAPNLYKLEMPEDDASTKTGMRMSAQAAPVPPPEAMRECMNCGKQIFTPFGQGSSVPNWQGHFCSERCRDQYIAK